MPSVWSKESIILEIKTLHRQGVKLNSGSIRKTHSRLYAASYQYFGGWKQAIEIAGIDYAEISVNIFSSPRELWTKEKIVSQIKTLHIEGSELNAAHAHKHYQKLYTATLTHFGGWAAAVQAAGFAWEEFAKRDKHTNWTKLAIVKAIKRRAKKKLPLNSHAVETSELSLWSAACRYYGSWRDALVVAGFDPSEIYLTRTWNRAQFAEEIKLLEAEGNDLCYTNMLEAERQDLLGVARKLYGSWPKALTALGYNYDDIRQMKHDYWNAQRVIDQLQALANNGEQLSHGWAKLNHNGLTHAALNHFGGWNEALEAAGLNYREHAKYWSSRAWLDRLTDKEYEHILSDTRTTKKEGVRE